MVDKKTAIIVVLCVVTILCLGLWASAGQEARRLEGEFGALGDRYASLNAEHVKIVEDYSNLITAEKDTLAKILSPLERKYDSLQNNHSILQSSFNNLKIDYDILLANHFTLKKDYDIIMENRVRSHKLLIELLDSAKDRDYFERAANAARTAITWDCLESWRGIADSDGTLHFVTEGVYVRSEIVKIVYNTFGGRYDTFEVQIHTLSDGQITQEARWDVHPHGALWTGIMWGEAYPLVVSRKVYYLEITGKYTEDFMQKLEGGMGFTENLVGRDYDYAIGLSVPADLSP